MISTIEKMNEDIVNTLEFAWATSITVAIRADAELLVKTCIENGLLSADGCMTKYVTSNVEVNVMCTKANIYTAFFYIKEDVESFAKVLVTTY